MVVMVVRSEFSVDPVRNGSEKEFMSSMWDETFPHGMKSYSAS